eukprot:3155329-Prymnesium_polylepis.2
MASSRLRVKKRAIELASTNTGSGGRPRCCHIYVESPAPPSATAVAQKPAEYGTTSGNDVSSRSLFTVPFPVTYSQMARHAA